MPHPYGLNEVQNEVRARAAALAAGVVRVHAREVDERGLFPVESMKALAEAGLLGLTVPREQGGAGEGLRSFAAAAEALAEGCASTAMIFVMHSAATQTIAASPTLAGRGALLRSIAKGAHLRGNESAPVVFDRLAVAGDDLVTPLGQGAPTMLQVVLPWFNVGTAAMANGLCRQALATTAAHLQSQGFAHTGLGLRDVPALRARLAHMSVRTDQARALLGLALAEIEEGSASAPLHVLQARLVSIEAAVAVTDLGMKACGGAAFSRHLDLERLFRDARAGWVMAPTVDHLRDFVGRSLTGLPLFADA